MAVQFGAKILDELFAPGISSFSVAEVPELGKIPAADHWLGNLFLNSLLGDRYIETWKQAAVSFLFRTQNSVRSYEAARTKTLECVKAFKPGRPATRAYFEAVSHWESVLLNVQIALDLFLKVMSPGTAETNDAKRIRDVVNRIKHYAEDIETGKNTSDLTLPMWLAKDRLITRNAEVTFAEIAENIQEMAKAADVLQDPSSKPLTP